MTNYPDLNKKDFSYTPTSKEKNITESYNSIKNNSYKIINKALSKKVSSIKNELKKVPAAYNKLRNNLTVSNNKIKKDTEEHIANTGNHTASGYALSKRMNNNSNYLSDLNNINIAEAEKISNLNSQIEDANFNAATERAKVANDTEYKKLQDILKENDRIDRLNFDSAKYGQSNQLDYDKLNEEKRVNNSKIAKTENDIVVDTSENQRKNEKHKVEMEYEPKMYQMKLDYEPQMYQMKLEYEPEIYKSKLEESKKNNELTDAKINKTNAETEEIKNPKPEPQKTTTPKETTVKTTTPKETTAQKEEATKTTTKKTSTTTKTSSSSTKNTSTQNTTKLTSKDIVTSIQNQAGKKMYDEFGESYIELDELKAYALLMGWKKKFNLPDQLVNDSAIKLGIQSYL